MFPEAFFFFIFSFFLVLTDISVTIISTMFKKGMRPINLVRLFIICLVFRKNIVTIKYRK